MTVLRDHQGIFGGVKIIEAAGSAKLREGVSMRVGGVVQRSDVKNANGRIYPRGLWERVLGSDDVKDKIDHRRMLGCLDHPDSGVTALEKSSHVVVGLKLNEDGVVYGEVDILKTPQGQILETLFSAGVEVGISSRGSGSVNSSDDGQVVDESDYVCETWDFVINPSTTGAFPSLIESTSPQNVDRFCRAVGNLVKKTADVAVLSEAKALLESLSADNEVLQRKAKRIVAKIDEKLTLENAVDKKSKRTTPLRRPPTRDGMTEKEISVRITEEVTRQTAAIQETYEDQADTLNERIDKLVTAKKSSDSKLAEATTKLTAAESLLDASAAKIKELVLGTVEVEATTTKLSAAEKIIEVLLRKVKIAESFRTRYFSAEKQLRKVQEAAEAKDREDAIDEIVCDLALDGDAETRVRSLLSEQGSVAEIRKTAEVLAEVAPSDGDTPRHHDPLPDQDAIRESLSRGRRSLKTGPTPKTGNTLTNALLKRVGGK